MQDIKEKQDRKLFPVGLKYIQMWFVNSWVLKSSGNRWQRSLKCQVTWVNKQMQWTYLCYSNKLLFYIYLCYPARYIGLLFHVSVLHSEKKLSGNKISSIAMHSHIENQKLLQIWTFWDVSHRVISFFSFLFISSLRYKPRSINFTMSHANLNFFQFLCHMVVACRDRALSYAVIVRALLKLYLAYCIWGCGA